MAVAGCEKHGAALALSQKGETSLAPLAGLETVTRAKAGAAQTSSAELSTQRVFMSRALSLSGCAYTDCKISLAGVNRVRNNAWVRVQPRYRSTRSATSRLFALESKANSAL